MGLPLLNIGATATSLATGLPGSVRGIKGLTEGLRFGAVLQQKLDGATDGTDALAQIEALLGSGTSIQTIAGQIGQQFAQQLAHAAPNLIDSQAQGKLAQTIASALAPPGTSPPGTSAAEQATALVARLTKIVNALARGAADTAGQQSRFSGQVLDANSARELPAQQTKSPAASAAEVASFVESILNSVAAQLQAPTAPTTSAGSPTSTTIASQRPPSLSAPSTRSSSPLQSPTTLTPSAALLQAVSASSDSSNNASQQQVPVNTSAVPQVTPDVQAAQAVPNAQPSDMLGRIIARAVRADAQLQSLQPALAGASARAVQQTPTISLAAHATPSSVPGQPGALPSVLVQRLLAVIAESTAQQNAGGRGGTNGGALASGQSNAASNALSNDGSQSTNAGFLNSLASVTNGTSAPTTSAPGNATPYVTDPQSIIDQVVKGIVVRDFGSTSEVRLRLQPENLGDVSLRLTVNGGTINASIVAQNADVRNLLVAHQQQLARSLADAGLSLGHFSVDVSGGNTNGSQSQAQQQQQRQALGTSSLRLGHLSLDDGTDDAQFQDPRFGPSIVGRPQPWVLNYLA